MELNPGPFWSYRSWSLLILVPLVLVLSDPSGPGPFWALWSWSLWSWYFLAPQILVSQVLVLSDPSGPGPFQALWSWSFLNTQVLVLSGSFCSWSFRDAHVLVLSGLAESLSVGDPFSHCKFLLIVLICSPTFCFLSERTTALQSPPPPLAPPSPPLADEHARDLV